EKDVRGKDIQTKADSSAKEEITASKEAPVATAKKKRVPEINWGIELSYGISANQEDAFSFFDGGQKSLDMVYNSPQYSTGSPVASTTFYSPSSIKAGAAFRAGLVGEMKISRKSSISSGLRYAYYSNSIKVGTYKDTAVSFTNSFSQDVNARGPIYRGVRQKEYTNRFHFIQLPLQYQWQLNKGVKMPILWNIGATAGYLISTNGLVYDTAASGIYYHDKKAFNKFNWSLNSGFSFRFGNKSKLQWSLGPELSLSMNKLTKADTKKQYLLYGGLTGRIIFAKKNK
ncbi:MAG TPA: outer membrane beta-barrel protein, partial [Chitinophagaceae bacterium]|nr:outer membrane beta-barrel protein [Chitinophagaceae bacterium]